MLGTELIKKEKNREKKNIELQERIEESVHHQAWPLLHVKRNSFLNTLHLNVMAQ